MTFWKTIPLHEMTDNQWDSLCDKCGLCCLHKFEDAETAEVKFTCVKCKYLGNDRQCKVYENRFNKVSGCLDIRTLPTFLYRWLPETCAYRRLHEKRSLPAWHPLITGSNYAMESAGHLVGDWAIPDTDVMVDNDFIVKLKVSDT